MRNPLAIAILFILQFFCFSCTSTTELKSQHEVKDWEIIPTPVTASLRGLSPLTDKIVWASGTGGTWLRTLDGGKSWDHGIIDGQDSLDFRDIEGMDALTAIAISAGQPAVIYKTVDGGKTWDKKFQGPEKAFLDGLAFNGKKLYVVGDEVDGRWMILESRDFGETWKWLETSPSAPEGAGSFAASGTSIVVDQNNIWFVAAGKNGKIYRSQDQGITWETYDIPAPKEEDSQGIFSLGQITPALMVAVGGDYLSPKNPSKNAMISQDFGRTWQLAKNFAPSGYRSGVAYFQKNHWLISVGPEGSDICISGGEQWEKFSEEGFHAVAVDKAKGSVWASGNKGKIGRLAF